MGLLFLVVGGALGTVGRWSVGRAAEAVLGSGFPYGTLLVNVVGSLVLGALAEHARTHGVAEHWRLGVGVGFCGGFTTYSAFNLEVLRELEDGAWGRAGLYVVSTLVMCAVAGLGGILLARRLV